MSLRGLVGGVSILELKSCVRLRLTIGSRERGSDTGKLPVIIGRKGLRGLIRWRRRPDRLLAANFSSSGHRKGCQVAAFCLLRVCQEVHTFDLWKEGRLAFA